MLPKQHRLTKTRDFENVHHRGKFIGEKFLGIKFLKNDLSVSRFGFLVGLKISKKSTKRNRVKRRIRESIRLKLKQIKPGFDIIIFTKPGIVKKTYQEIDEAVEKVFKKARLFHKNTRTK
jgi:ribonuclease P protein component